MSFIALSGKIKTLNFTLKILPRLGLIQLMNTFLKLTIISCLAFILSACGSDSDSDEPSFASTLEPSVYKNGEWNFSNITIDYNVYDSESASWEERRLRTNPGTLTILDNGLEGTVTIASMRASGESIIEDGASSDGFIVGETLDIKGYIDGTTMGLILTSESGMTASLISAPYDGDVYEDENNLWTGLGYWDGVSEVSIEGTVSGEDSYISDPYYDDSTVSTSSPSPTEVLLGSGNSIYVDGNYTGDGYTYMAYFDESWGYESITYDLDVTVSENTMTGTMTLTSLDDLPSLEGYEVGDTFEVNGTIQGAIVHLTCTDPDNSDFSWKHIWGSSSLSGQSQPVGELTSIQAYYGVTYRTEGTFGGENEVTVYFQTPE